MSESRLVKRSARIAIVSLAAALVACGLDVSGELAGDADGGLAPATDGAPSLDANADTSAPDAGAHDAGAPDGQVADASQVDASQVDASQADVSQPDASQPDSAPADASLPDAGHDAGCSVSSSSPVSLKFENNSSSTTYEKIWVNFQCQDQSFGNIDPGEKQMIGSYATHVWKMRDTSTNQIVKTVTLPVGGSFTIKVP